MKNDYAAHDFLAELYEINGFITDVLASPRNAHWHWPSFYLLYVEVDRLTNILVRVNFLFSPSCASSGDTAEFGEHVEGPNELFELLDKQQKTIVRWLYQMYRYTQPNPSDPSLRKRLRAHFHPKSGWYQTFMVQYRSGIFSVDGNTLCRSILPIDHLASGDRINHMSAEYMIRHQSFDISTLEARRSLAHAADAVALQLGAISAAMTTLLRAHCTLEDLLNPSSH